MRRLYALLQGLRAARIRQTAWSLVQALRAGKGLRGSRRSARSVPTVFLPLDDGWDDAGRVEAGPSAVRAVHLSDQRIHLRSGRPRLAGRVAQGPLFRRLARDGENAARAEAPCHHVRWRPSDARHARRDLVSWY